MSPDRRRNERQTPDRRREVRRDVPWWGYLAAIGAIGLLLTAFWSLVY